MEPYVIICQSCTARLKVTNEALIGQRLACPKCQAMIEVVAPEGYKPPAIKNDSEANAGSDSAISGNFEDIDSLLASAHQGRNDPQPKPRKKSSPKKKSKPQPGDKPKLTPLTPAQTTEGIPRPKRSTGVAASGETTSTNQQQPSEPSLLPNSQWDSEAARKKKRILQIVMLALLATVAIGASVWALLGIGSTDKADDTIAKKDPAVIQSPTDADPDALNAVAKPPSSATSLSDGESTKVGNTSDETNVTDTTSPTGVSPTGSPSELSPQAVVNNSASQSSPPPLEVATPPDSTTSIDPAPKKSADPDDTATSPLANNTTDPTSTAEDNSPLIPSTENSLGKLSEILKGQGTSLKEIEDIAEIQKERALIGTPTYLIERPNRKALNIERQLAAELSGWKLDNVPLIDAIKDLEMISDVPVTFAPELFHDGRFEFTRPITLKVEAVTVKAAFERLLAEDGLTAQPTAAGVKISTPQSNDVFTKSYPQNFCTNENSISRLRDLIIAVTGITDWNDDEYKLEVLADSVSVSHRQNEHRQIDELLQKLNAAANYKNDAAAMKTTLLPLALKAENTMALSPELKTINPYRHSMRLGSLFRQVRQATNLATIIDWENLAKQGWYPNTITPGRLAEPTNRQLLEQLGHSMEATTIVIGPDIVMLTTFENAGQQRDIEVYSVGDVIDNKMTAPQLDQLLTETLGIDQLTPPNAVVIYFAECKCLVAKAPQIVQRQLHLIVNEL